MWERRIPIQRIFIPAQITPHAQRKLFFTWWQTGDKTKLLPSTVHCHCSPLSVLLLISLFIILTTVLLSPTAVTTCSKYLSPTIVTNRCAIASKSARSPTGENNLCHQALSPIDVTNYCHESFSPTTIINRCHQPLSPPTFTDRGHQPLSLTLHHWCLVIIAQMKQKKRINEIVPNFQSSCWLQTQKKHTLNFTYATTQFVETQHECASHKKINILLCISRIKSVPSDGEISLVFNSFANFGILSRIICLVATWVNDVEKRAKSQKISHKLTDQLGIWKIKQKWWMSKVIGLTALYIVH